VLGGWTEKLSKIFFVIFNIHRAVSIIAISYVYHEDGVSRFRRNVGMLLQNYKALYSR
jgi:hypothetical protein